MITKQLGSLDTPLPFDVCIVGSGFSGTTLAHGLVERGARVLMLESGSGLARWLLDSRIKELATYRVTGTTNYLTARTKARALGGNSNFWTGRCERYHPSDFEIHPYTPTDCPWPIDYPRLEPYYDQAERTLRVRGGKSSEYMPPRRRGFPVRSKADISSLQDRLASVGITLDHSPTATPLQALRFFRVQREILPQLAVISRCVVLQGVTATKLITDAQKRVVSVEVRTLDGATRQAKARIYVVACGGIETPRLLLLSSSEHFPGGIGNSYDRVGRGFNEHPGLNFFGKIRHDRHTLSPRHVIARCHQIYGLFRREGLGSILPVFIQSWYFPNHLLTPSVREVLRSMGNVLKRILRPTLYIGATIEMRPVDTNRVTLSEEVVDRFGNPVAHLHLDFTAEDRRMLHRARHWIREVYGRLGAAEVVEGELTWSRHHIGTCRMGENPRASVTNSELKVHDCSNLYLCGSEVFVTGAAVPPVLTIVSLAHRLADHLQTRLQNGAYT